MKYIKPIFSLFLMLLFAMHSGAQNTVNSPYSSYGLGEQGGMDHAIFGGIGNNNITYIDSNILNFYNPASYSALAKGKPLFSFGVSSRLSTYSEDGIKSFSPVTNIQHLVLAFPVHKYFGMSAGLRQYARRGYNFENTEAIGPDTVHYFYTGSGGVNEVFLGLGTDIISFKNTSLSLGSNLGFLFGETTNTRKSALYSGADTTTGGVNDKITHINDFHFDLGLYFSQKFSRYHEIGLAAVIDPSQRLNGTFNNTLYFAGNINEPDSYQALISTSIKDTLISAGRMSFGFKYSLMLPDTAKNRKLNSEIALHASYTLEDWSRYSNPFDETEMLSTNKLAVGVQFTPEMMLAVKFKTVKFYEKMRYRAGYYQYTLPYAINGKQLSDKGFTFGLGFPLALNSSVNAGFSYGVRGTGDNNHLQENYYGINIGITIAPVGEVWFRKPKLN